MDRKIVRADQPFAVQLPNGTPLMIQAGDLFYSDDPVVKDRERLFGDVSIRTSAGPRERSSVTGSAVETASAEPGGRRRMTRPKGPDTIENDEV